MNLHCIKRFMFTKNNNIKIKREIDVKIDFYSSCIDCGFKTFETIDKKPLRFVISLNYM